MTTIPTANLYRASMAGDSVVLLRPPLGWRIHKTDALNLAAWLVALADDNDEFEELLGLVVDGERGDAAQAVNDEP